MGLPCNTVDQTINVISLSGEHLCNIPVEQDLARLKTAVAKAAGVPEWQQLLISDGQPLQDGTPLRAMLRGPEYTVMLLRKTEDALTMDKMMSWHLKHVIDKRFLDDRSFMLAAVELSGAALSHASSEMRKDPELVLTAVKTHGAALQFADMQLRQDPDFMLSAVKANSSAISYASKELLENKGFLLAAARANCDIIGFIGRATQIQFIRKDKDAMLSIVQVHGSALRFASPELRRDRELIIAALRADPHARRFCPVDMQRDSEILYILAANEKVVQASPGMPM